MLALRLLFLCVVVVVSATFVRTGKTNMTCRTIVAVSQGLPMRPPDGMFVTFERDSEGVRLLLLIETAEWTVLSNCRPALRTDGK